VSAGIGCPAAAPLVCIARDFTATESIVDEGIRMSLTFGSLTFASPWFLGLLIGLPLVFWWARRSMAGLGRMRALLAMGLRLTLIVLLVFALAEAQSQHRSQAVCVVYLLDHSQSIPREQRDAMFEYVIRDVAQYRDLDRGDRAGIIVFGREAAVEIPPTRDDFGWLRRSELLLPRLEEATDLAAAMKLAVSIFPPDSSRRVVIVSDGNENRGSARDIAFQYQQDGIGVDVVAVPLERGQDVSIERLVLPNRAHQDATIEARVVIVNDRLHDDDSGEPTRGTLRITRQNGNESQVVLSEEVTLAGGKNVYSLPHMADLGPGFYTYEALFQPADSAVIGASSIENKRAKAFTNVEGRGRVLLLENPDTAGGFDFLARRLRAAGITVDVRNSGELFSTFAELQSYDSVVLADLPRSYGPDAGEAISDQQIELLVRNTEFGCGLVMLGGPNSFGAGGWTNTRLEEASPLNFTVKNMKVVPAGALVIVIDKSGSMQGERIAMCRQAAIAAIKTLGSNDYVGVVVFDGDASWLVPLQKIAGRRDVMNSLIRRLGADGGTNMYPGMYKAYEALRTVDTPIKHMIVLSDGHTQPGEFDRLARTLRQEKITVSTVAVGQGADRPLLTRISQIGGGKFYNVVNSRLIPQIFIKEAMRVTRPLVYERREGFVPQIVGSHEALTGLTGQLPPIRGFVLTERKDNPLVHVGIKSPMPGDDEASTIFASWNYGLGRSVAITTDAGQRWAADWPDWEHYDRFYEQIVRWSMRPGGDQGDVLVATQIIDDRLQVVVTAVDEEGRPRNFLDLKTMVMTPGQGVESLSFQQAAPGRYVGEFPVEEPGNYFLMVQPGVGSRPVRVGVHVPASVEFMDRETNWNLLQSLADMPPVGGEPGILRRDGLRVHSEETAAYDTFRPTLASSIAVRDLWPFLVVFTSCALFLDVLVRRVAIDWAGRAAALRKRLQRPAREFAGRETVDRLRARKAAVQQNFEVRDWAPSMDLGDEPQKSLAGEILDKPPKRQAPPEFASSEGWSQGSQDDSYTSRLLQAKRRARRSAGDAEDSK